MMHPYNLLCLLFVSLALVGTIDAQTTVPIANITIPVANISIPIANITIPIANITIPVANITIPITGNFTIPRYNSTAVPFTSPDIPEIPESAFQDVLFEIEQTEQVERSPENLEIAQADEYEIDQADDLEVEQAQEYEIQQGEGEPLGAAYLATLRAPPKQRLATRTIDLGVETESMKMEEAPPSPPLEALAPKRLPRQVLAKQHAPRLGLRRLPQKVSAAKEHRPVRMLPPLAPRKRAPQYRQQLIKQEVVQPIVQIQPMLHQRVLTRTIHQPTLQKQPVIQRIITQPILRRVTREQPITQEQITYQNIVKTREVKKPEVREELKVEREKKPVQTVEEKGAPFPRLTQPPKKHH